MEIPLKKKKKRKKKKKWIRWIKVEVCKRYKY
jgi:hypothetical protein